MRNLYCEVCKKVIAILSIGSLMKKDVVSFCPSCYKKQKNKENNPFFDLFENLMK